MNIGKVLSTNAVSVRELNKKQMLTYLDLPENFRLGKSAWMSFGQTHEYMHKQIKINRNW